jgi:hypothetical protein
MRREAAEIEVLIEIVLSETSSEDSFVCSQPMGAKVFGKSSVVPLGTLSPPPISRHLLARCIWPKTSSLAINRGYFAEDKNAEQRTVF